MIWQKRPDWWDDAPIHQQPEWLDWMEANDDWERRRRQRDYSRQVLAIWVFGMLAIIVWCLVI